MFRLRSRRPANGSRHGLALALLLQALTVADGDAAARDTRLALEVRINGYETKLIGNFVMRSDQRLGATRKELRELGIEPGSGANEQSLALDEVEGLTYHYDPERQSLDLQLPTQNLATQRLGPQPLGEPPAVAAANNPSAVINYGLTVSASDDELRRHYMERGSARSDLATLSLDTRLSGPLGNIVNTGVIGADLTGAESALRLESAWNWSDPSRLWTWSAGDFVTRGLAWSRPVRFGGLQWSTNFALRPDLVTVPQPELAGLAAVPSSVDVFINNTRSYSGEVRPGPFQVANLPATTGAGVARLVVRDAAGREIVQTKSFYASPTILRSGLFEHSVELGVARRNFGLVSGDYDDRLAGVASLRYGYFDHLTLEAHAESMQDLFVGGVGFSATILDRAVLSMAASGSHGSHGSGMLAYAALETKVGPVSLNVSSQRTFGTYKDLAAAIPRHAAASIADRATFDPPRALDIASISAPIDYLGGSLNFNIINRKTDSGATRLLAASYSRQLFGKSTLLVSGFQNLTTSSSTFFASISVPLGQMGHAHAHASTGGTQSAVGVDYAKVASQEPGSFGWRFSERRAGTTEARSGALTYQSSVARLETGVEQIGSVLRLRTMADGALVLSSHGPMLSNRIDDAFAVVDVGHPGVPVSLENRVVAITNSDGLALVPGVRSHQTNRISINPDALPADITVSEVRTTATPADRGGATVQFALRRTSGSAIVVFRNADGSFVEPGSDGIVDASGRTFVVGYDGRAYIEDLALQNRVIISTPAGTCVANFAIATAAAPRAGMSEAVCR